MITPIDSVANPSPTASQPAGGGSSAASSTNGLLAPNQFLNLLVDNLKYQNPLNPTSSADFLTQLAALSQVDTLQQVAQADQTSTAANLLGRTVSGSDASGNPLSGTVTGISLTSNGPVLSVGKDTISLGSVTSVS
ncbi:MAG TPA: flagellar hook capping FlgD N-terminal domain-containing protein [Acidimicrobiales bacterium]|nr:flagellar hook capping FlgD N-terminal domain-containing protein [Acidimicrobiales bacterium]